MRIVAPSGLRLSSQPAHAPQADAQGGEIVQRGRGGGRQNTGHTKGKQGAVEAVSYTHLDVYKRQNLWFAGEAYWENIHTSRGDQYANTLQSLMPFSYTHLDVYKRQIYAYADTEAKRKAIEKAMGTGLTGTESVNYTVRDEDMLRRLYGL